MISYVKCGMMVDGGQKLAAMEWITPIQTTVNAVQLPKPRVLELYRPCVVVMTTPSGVFKSHPQSLLHSPKQFDSTEAWSVL